MYTDDDIDFAISKGIFSKEAAVEFRVQISSRKGTSVVDEENFRLVTSFNDVFVVIACLLLVFSSLWVLRSWSETLGLAIVPILSWGLAEVFVRKRKMALPAIFLLLSFVGGVFSFGEYVFQALSESSVVFAAAFAALASYFHWRRFKVPITVAAGTAAGIGSLVTLVLATLPSSADSALTVVALFGVVVFVYAMYWDASDRTRSTYRTDVAFWLHLLSAPLIVHPVFSKLGILDGNETFGGMVIVLLLYLVMTLVSIAIDRRAFMVSSLGYVLYTVSSLFTDYGSVGYSFALTGICIGVALLMLSVFWSSSRTKLVTKLPSLIQEYLPAVAHR